MCIVGIKIQDKETDDCQIIYNYDQNSPTMIVIKEADFNWYECLSSLLTEQIMSIIEGLKETFIVLYLLSSLIW